MKRSLISLLVFDIIFFGALIYIEINFSSVLLDIRQALFSKITTRDRAFNENMDFLVKKYGFKKDKPRIISKWENILSKEVDYFNSKKYNIYNMQSEIDKARSISLMISKNGGPIFTDNTTLLEKVKMLPENNGRGICNDHTQVFLAMSSIFGLIAREMYNKLHVFIEFYDRSMKKWIFIDPQYAIMAKDGNGIYLSLLEMRHLYIRQEKIDFDFFGNGFHAFSKQEPQNHPYYNNKENFSYVVMNLGNNVFEQDKFFQRLNFLPKSFEQIINLTMGFQPRYIMFTDDESVVNRWIIKKFIYIMLIVFIVFLHIAVITYRLKEWIFRKEKRRFADAEGHWGHYHAGSVYENFKE